MCIKTARFNIPNIWCMRSRKILTVQQYYATIYLRKMEVRSVEENELYRLLEEGLAEIEAGETYSIQEVFEEIEEELYN